MGALAHYIERSGVATTSISLVREQSERVRPPRALWVPFALGRPLGSAGEIDFQHRVLGAAFDLLATATEPVIADFDEEAPDEAGPGVWACPVRFDTPQAQSLGERLTGEVARLRPWALETRRTRGRSFFGASGARLDQVDEVVGALIAIAESGELKHAPSGSVEWRFDMPLLIRHLADDLRTFYHEALAAQPGPGAPNHDALNEWIFGGTALGDVFLAIADHLTEAGQLGVRGILIPEGHYRGGRSFPNTPEFGASEPATEVDS